MRLTIKVVLFSTVLLLAGAPVLAAEFSSRQTLEERLALVEPGVLPDSFWYWADIYGEELRYLFLWGKEARADYLTVMAEERLAEMKKLSEEGIKGYAEKLMNRHENLLYKARSLYEKLEEEAAAGLLEAQKDAEDEIYLREMETKNEIRQAPENLTVARDSFFATIADWFKKVKDHLRWKKGAVEEQRANHPGY